MIDDRFQPKTISTYDAVLGIARDYVTDREPRDGDEANELQEEAIANACAVLGIQNPANYNEELHDELMEELDSGMRTPTDESRGEGPRHHSEY